MAINSSLFTRTLLGAAGLAAAWGLYAVADQSVNTEGKLPETAMLENTGQWNKPDDAMLKQKLTDL